MSARLAADARRIADAAIAAADPVRLMRETIAKLDAETLAALESAPVIHVAGAGKAGERMARGLVEGLTPELAAKLRGTVLVAGEVGTRTPVLPPPPLRGRVGGGGDAPQPEGPWGGGKSGGVELVAVRPPGRNAVTPEAVAATEFIVAQLRAAGPDDALIGLWSGGGSAMLALPAVGVPLAEKLALTQALQAAGADIRSVNTVRKHLSQVKGGKLARLFAGRAGVSFALSDVIGDDLATIASGPTVADNSTPSEAMAIIGCDGLLDFAPESIPYLWDRQSVQATPTGPVHPTHLIGSNRTAVLGAVQEAQSLGYAALDLGSYLDGDNYTLAGFVARLVRSIRSDGVPLRPPCALVMGGETTVKLRPNPGQGGRNQEFVIGVAHELGGAGLDGVAVLSVGTDGEDGPTDAAGGYVDAEVWTRAGRSKALAFAALDRNASYDWLKATGGLVVTGPTGTNVADVRVVLIV